MGRFSDESFRVRDIQFNQPAIFVESQPLFGPFGDVHRRTSRGRTDLLPAIIARPTERSFKDRDVRSSRQQQEKQGTPVGIPLVKDEAESPLALGAANQAVGFDRRGEPIFAHPAR